MIEPQKFKTDDGQVLDGYRVQVREGVTIRACKSPLQAGAIHFNMTNEKTWNTSLTLTTAAIEAMHQLSKKLQK
jgi:hypothetical protein